MTPASNQSEPDNIELLIFPRPPVGAETLVSRRGMPPMVLEDERIITALKHIEDYWQAPPDLAALTAEAGRGGAGELRAGCWRFVTQLLSPSRVNNLHRFDG